MVEVGHRQHEGGDVELTRTRVPLVQGAEQREPNLRMKCARVVAPTETEAPPFGEVVVTPLGRPMRRDTEQRQRRCVVLASVEQRVERDAVDLPVAPQERRQLELVEFRFAELSNEHESTREQVTGGPGRVRIEARAPERRVLVDPHGAYSQRRVRDS